MTTTDNEPQAQPAELLARLFGTTVEEMRERPEVLKEKFATVFGELAELKSRGDGARNLDATKELLRRLKRELEASGEAVPGELEELPEQLAGLADQLGGATPGELAELLRGLAGSIESPSGDGDGANLDEVAAWFETNFGSFVGFERRRRKEDARMQAEYREAAKRSIAASLRAHGIQPLTTDPVAPRASMKRQHLFWKEFAASAEEVRALVSGGEVDEAKKRVTEMLDAFDLDLSIKLSLEDDVAVLAFMPADDLATATELQLVVRDSPKLPGWRFVRGRRYGAAT